MGSSILHMFVRLHSLVHQERKLMAPGNFMKIITLRFFCRTPQFLVSSGLIKQSSFNVLEEKQPHKVQ